MSLWWLIQIRIFPRSLLKNSNFINNVMARAGKALAFFCYGIKKKLLVVLFYPFIFIGDPFRASYSKFYVVIRYLSGSSSV